MVGNLNLNDAFPRLFTISSNKGSSIWHAGERSQNSEWNWKIKWRRNLFEWDQNQEQQLMQVLGDQRVKLDKENSWAWKDKELVVFTVKSTNKVLKEDV